MPNKASNFFRSFSFRAGVIFFIAMCTTLVALRIHTYYQSLSTTYEDIRAVINAHAEEIDQGVEKYGPSYAEYLVKALLEETADKHLYLLFYNEGKLTGNLKRWPKHLNYKTKWQEISLSGELPPNENEDKPLLNLLVKVTTYKHESYMLLIGYNLQRVEFLRTTLLRVAITNIVLSLLMSFALSVMLVWLVNRHLMRINRACERVMRGQLKYRVSTLGSHDQFDKLGDNINGMLDWIETLLGTVRDSTNAIAHDMRTPLSRHRLELRALMDDTKLPQKTQEKIRDAVARVDGIVEMFDNILSISKAESRTGTELFTEIDLREIVTNVIEFYEALIEEKSQQLEEDIPPQPVKITGDKQLISQAIVNLLDNAVKYTPKGGKIRVSLRQDGDLISIIVADNGPGIPDELLDKAKERFFRVDESRNTPGTGLGLSLANAVAGLHHGTLTLENNQPGLRATLQLSKKTQTDH